NDSGLDCHNYSATLQGWASQRITGRTLGAAGLQYNEIGLLAKNTLTSTPQNWTITDAGFSSVCPPNVFITEWNTEATTSITIPTIGIGYNYSVYWENMSNPSVNGILTNQTGNAIINSLTSNTD